MVARERQRQVNFSTFQASLVYRENSRTSRPIKRNPILRNQLDVCFATKACMFCLFWVCFYVSEYTCISVPQPMVEVKSNLAPCGAQVWNAGH